MVRLFNWIMAGYIFKIFQSVFLTTPYMLGSSLLKQKCRSLAKTCTSITVQIPNFFCKYQLSYRFSDINIEGYQYELKKCNLYTDMADLVKEKLTEVEAIKRAFHYRLRIKDIKNQHHGLD